MANKLYLLVMVLLIVLVVVFITLFLFNPKPEYQTTLFEAGKGKIGESIDVPAGKYPNGFPIEILESKDEIVESQRYFSGYCRWHPEADSSIGGKIAVVPVVLYKLHFDL